MRLICAIIVLISHLDWIAGNPTDRFRQLGLYAVAIFFGLSGFLLTETILRNGANTFFVRNRIIRIFPGFIGVLLSTTFFFAPLFQMIKTREFRYFFTEDNVLYVFRNISTYILQPDINGSLEANSVRNWNPPLWTLSYELFCYCFLFILVRTLAIKFALFINVFLPIFIGFYLLEGFSLFYIPDRIIMTIYFTSFFFLGSFLYLRNLQHSFHLFLALVFVSPLLFLIPRNSHTSFYDSADFVIGLFLIPLTLFLAFNMKIPIKLRNDYSFGIYIYSAPVSQLLVFSFNGLRFNWIFYSICTLVITLIFAWLSWHMIEKQAFRFKKSTRG